MSAIIAPIDWPKLAALPDEDAAVVLDSHARTLDGLSKRLFIERGLIMLEMDERGLWRHLDDPETGLPYHSFERWACTAFDYSRRDCFYAKAAAKELRDIPRQDLIAMPRANIEVMKALSSAVRKEVVKEAKARSAKDFVDYIEDKYPEQHIEQRRTIHIASDKTDSEDIEQAIEVAMALEGCTSRSEAMRAICISYLQENLVEYERLKA